jgi:hypothetical protein
MSFTGFSDQIDPERRIQNALFWPDLSPAEFCAGYRIPAEYRQEMVENRLSLAMVWVNGQLSAWRAAQQAAGFPMLEDVPVDDQDLPGDGHPLLMWYVRAVSCKAKALLLADYATMMRKSDARADARNNTVESEDTADLWHRFASDAINAIQGKLNIHAELL